MADTQWPRFQVFLQEKAGAPHQDVGSVHAPDPELALLNARDVFVRRPECTSLWVVPAEAIFSRTKDEMGRGELKELRELRGTEGSSAVEDEEAYLVFCKVRAAGTQTLVGEVLASSPEQAMRRAVETYSGQQGTAFAWWVFPARLVSRTEPEDVDSMFSPARDKLFRQSTDFHTVTMMREIKKS